jgi:hypothetical protein
MLNDGTSEPDMARTLRKESRDVRHAVLRTPRLEVPVGMAADRW